MTEYGDFCPACAARPLLPTPQGRVACPRGHVFEFTAAWYWGELTNGERPRFPGRFADLDVAGYDLPLYLGYTVGRRGRWPVLRCVCQTAAEALALLRAGYDLRRYEPVVVALLAAGGSPAEDGLNWGRAA